MKGIMLTEYDNYFMNTYSTNLFGEYVKFFNTLEYTPEVKEYIESNNIKFAIVGYKAKLKGIDIPVICNGGDPARRLSDNSFKIYCKENNIKGIITHNHCTIEAFKDYFSGMDMDIFYMRRGINLDVMKDYGLNKEYDVVNIGKLSSYQYRREANDSLRQLKGIQYKNLYNKPLTDSIDYYISYAQNLNRSWIALGGCMQEVNISYYKDKLISDTFPKNLEIPACRTCLLTTDWGDREFLGFEDNVNCLIFKNIREMNRKILYYKTHNNKLEEVIRRGYELVHKNHDIKETIPELIKEIEKKYGG